MANGFHFSKEDVKRWFESLNVDEQKNVFGELIGSATQEAICHLSSLVDKQSLSPMMLSNNEHRNDDMIKSKDDLLLRCSSSPDLNTMAVNAFSECLSEPVSVGSLMMSNGGNGMSSKIHSRGHELHMNHNMNHNNIPTSLHNGLSGLGNSNGHANSLTSTNSPPDRLDINFDLITHQMAQLSAPNNGHSSLSHSYMDETSSIATSSANTPSPTPLYPLDESTGLVLNEAVINNLSQLARISSANSNSEHQNGLVATTSTSPLSVTPTPSIGNSVSPFGNGRSSAIGSKPNVMQIRCKFGQLGPAKGQFSSPHGFCLGVDEEIVIADTNNHRICIFDKNGDFKHSFGVPGKDEAQLWYPRKVAIIRSSPGHGVVAAPRYVICDRGSERSRMQIFTRSGHFVRKIAIRYIDIVAGLAITPNGYIVAVDSVSPTVFVISETGDLLRWFDCSEYMREPSDIAVSNREYYICDFKGHCVVVFNEEGQYVRKIGGEGITSFPNGIDISDAGDVLIGDSHGNRFHVVVFDRSGSLISEFECPYVKVSRCCGLKITSEGYIVTLAKNNHHVLILNTLYIM